MANVLIAGGAGFIGSHLVDQFLNRGDRVVCVDDLSTGTRQSANIHSGHGEYRFVELDVVDPQLTNVLGDERFDVVAHLASAASPPAYLARPIETLDAGSIGTRALLEIAKRDQAKFLLASTSEVYGDPLVHPQPETYWGHVNPIGERSVYDEAKRFAEALTMAYARTFGVAVRIARIFNTYGPRMRADDGRVVTNMIVQALEGSPLTIFGSGNQTRSFCFITDQVAGLLALVDGDAKGPINIGNADEVTVNQLAELTLELTGSASSIEHRPLPMDDPVRRCPDIGLARELLGWTPKVALRDGLLKTIAAHPVQLRA